MLHAGNYVMMGRDLLGFLKHSVPPLFEAIDFINRQRMLMTQISKPLKGETMERLPLSPGSPPPSSPQS